MKQSAVGVTNLDAAIALRWCNGQSDDDAVGGLKWVPFNSPNLSMLIYEFGGWWDWRESSQTGRRSYDLKDSTGWPAISGTEYESWMLSMKRKAEWNRVLDMDVEISSNLLRHLITCYARDSDDGLTETWRGSPLFSLKHICNTTGVSWVYLLPIYVSDAFLCQFLRCHSQLIASRLDLVLSLRDTYLSYYSLMNFITIKSRSCVT